MTRYLLVISHLTSVIFLASCGFEPMQGRSTASSPGALAAKIEVSAVAQDQERRRMAETFRYSLEDLLNPGGDVRPAAYRLNASLATTEVPVSIARDGTISRYNVQIDAVLTLSRLSDGATVYTGQARRTGSYNNVSNAFYSTYVSSEDTLNRTAKELAEDVRMRMASLFARNPNPPALTTEKTGVKPLPAPIAPLPPRPGEL